MAAVKRSIWLKMKTGALWPLLAAILVIWTLRDKC